jgi:hypothetical protein
MMPLQRPSFSFEFQATNMTSATIASGTTATTFMAATAYLNGQLVAEQVPVGEFFGAAVVGRVWTTMETFRLE